MCARPARSSPPSIRITGEAATIAPMTATPTTAPITRATVVSIAVKTRAAIGAATAAAHRIHSEGLSRSR